MTLEYCFKLGDNDLAIFANFFASAILISFLYIAIAFNNSEEKLFRFDCISFFNISSASNSAELKYWIALLKSDSKYAFISVEGVGGEPGTVDIINLETLNLISSVNTGKQAGGIAFWKISH